MTGVAAALNAALRITTEDVAAAVEDRVGPALVEAGIVPLSEAVRATTRGVLGGGGQPVDELP